MNNVTRALRTLTGLAMLLALSAALTRAQQPTPTPQKHADARTQSSPAPKKESEGDYTVTSSMEFGYRGLRVGGNLNKYQSDLNYKTGPRVFDSSFLVKGKEGAAFDTLLVTSTGWGGDPYGHLRISVENSKWFRLDGNYRKFKYFSALNNIVNPTFAPPSRQADPVQGWHSMDIRQQVGDFDLTVLPKNRRIRFNFGYSPERYSGPAFTSWHYGGDDFQLLSQARSKADDFRFGADWRLGGFDFSLLQGLRHFSDDTSINNQYLNLGANPTASTTALTSITRLAPVRGNVNYTRFSVHTLVARRLDMTARVVYSSATTDINNIERATGVNFNTRITGIPATYNPPNILTLGQWTYLGGAKRPNTLVDFGATYTATEKLRLSNTLRVETFQINGGDLYNGLFQITRTNGTALAPLTPTAYGYEATKYRKVQDTVEADYQFNERYAFHLGYRYGTRRVERFFAGYNLSNNGTLPLTPEQAAPEFEQNHTNAVLGGFKIRPVKTWTLFFDAERGTADNVFTRVGNYDYTNLRARTRYTPTRKFALNLAFITRDNSNPSAIDGVSLEDFGVKVKSRVFTSSVDYTPDARLSFSAGYNYNWANSDAVIQYAFLSTTNAAIRGHSLYFMRNNFFHFDVAAQPMNRVSFFASYRVNKDTGQGDRVSNPAGGLLVTSYPMSFQSPEARLSFRISRRLDWNLGYQYYNYNESDLQKLNVVNYVISPRAQNYHAHLPYASLRFYFGGGER
ncbi:MAG: hypothetical protein ACJ74Q_03605 [Pyrinomonadaceae bacterium]